MKEGETNGYGSGMTDTLYTDAFSDLLYLYPVALVCMLPLFFFECCFRCVMSMC
jgi:hypothetical protein